MGIVFPSLIYRTCNYYIVMTNSQKILMNNRMTKFSAALFAGMFLILSYTIAFDLFVMGKPIGPETCTQDFWSQTCC
jgi:hypothetical protein